MHSQTRLEEHEDNWVTYMGEWYAGEKVIFRGKNLHTELKDMDWMELYLFGITGRKFTKNQIKVFQAMWTYTSYPEPRLWNNRIAALAGTVRSTATLALGTATVASEASIYGHKPNIRAIDFFIRTKKRIDRGDKLLDCLKEEFKKHRNIYGYGRPLNREDERNQYFLALLKETGMDTGPHLQIALDAEKLLKEGRWRIQLNITGLDAAVAADMGLTPREHHLFAIFCFTAGMSPCFLDTNSRPIGTFFPVRCSRIDYRGAEKRQWI